MTTLLPNLIDALRLELQQYGELLALLDHQHHAILSGGPEAVFQSVTAIHAQRAAVQAACEARQRCQEQLAAALGLEDAWELTRLLARVPEPWRPLLAALVQENNDLRARTRTCAERNHQLLRQSLELLQRFILTLQPAAQPVLLPAAQTAALETQPEWTAGATAA